MPTHGFECEKLKTLGKKKLTGHFYTQRKQRRQVSFKIHQLFQPIFSTCYLFGFIIN